MFRKREQQGNKADGPAGATKNESKGGKKNISGQKVIDAWIIYRADVILHGGKEPDRCEWLKQNKNRFTRDEYRQTAKQWDCRHHGMQVSRKNK